MLFLKLTAPPPFRAATGLNAPPQLHPWPSCKGFRGRGYLGSSPVGWGHRPGEGPHHPPGTLTPRPGVQSQRAGARFRAGKLAPEGEAAPQGEAGGEGGAEEEVGGGWGGSAGEREAARRLAAAGALLLSRRGEEMALSALQSRRVCVQPGLVGKGGEGGDNTQVTG